MLAGIRDFTEKGFLIILRLVFKANISSSSFAISYLLNLTEVNPFDSIFPFLYFYTMLRKSYIIVMIFCPEGFLQL